MACSNPGDWAASEMVIAPDKATTALGAMQGAYHAPRLIKKWTRRGHTGSQTGQSAQMTELVSTRRQGSSATRCLRTSQAATLHFTLRAGSDAHLADTRMPKENNPAARLRAILKVARTTTQLNDGLSGWSKVFGVQEESVPVRERRVARFLELMQDQLEEVGKGLARLNWDPEAYQATLNRLGNFVSLRTLSANWQQQVASLSDESISNLLIYAQALPEDDTSLTADELGGLKEEILDLKKHVRASDLPQNLIDFLLKQLKIIEDAILEYPIRGATAFTNASSIAAAGWLDAPIEIRDYRGREEVKRVVGAWDRFKKYGDRFLYVSAIVMAIQGDIRALTKNRQPRLLPGPTTTIIVGPESNVEFDLEENPPATPGSGSGRPESAPDASAPAP